MGYECWKGSAEDWVESEGGHGGVVGCSYVGCMFISFGMGCMEWKSMNLAEVNLAVATTLISETGDNRRHSSPEAGKS